MVGGQKEWQMAFEADEQIKLKYAGVWLFFLQKALEALYYEANHYAMVLTIKCI